MTHDRKTATGERSAWKRWGFAALRFFVRLIGVTCFGMRCFGRNNIPAQGALLVCSNHQSVMDPVLVGLAFDRRLNYLARQTLFGFAPFRWLIEFLDAIPIDREGLGLAGLRESLRRLKRGEAVLIFPEGTRTPNGSLMPLQPGFCALARRHDVTVLPVALDGAFDAWPREAKLPRLSTISVCIGEPLAPAELNKLDDYQLVAEVTRRMQRCFARAQARRTALPAASP